MIYDYGCACFNIKDFDYDFLQIFNNQDLDVSPLLEMKLNSAIISRGAVALMKVIIVELRNH